MRARPDAPVIVTANPGCLLQMRAGAQIHSTGQEVVHVVELLDRALAKRSLVRRIRRESASDRLHLAHNSHSRACVAAQTRGFSAPENS